MQQEDAIDPIPAIPAAPPREPTSRLTRKGSSRMSKLAWPLSLGVAGLLIYGAFSPDSRKGSAHAEETEAEQMRPAPRTVPVAPVVPEPIFKPAPAAAPKAAALPPLPPDAVLPPVGPDASAIAEQKATATKDAAEAARLRRKAPLMVDIGSSNAPIVVARDDSAGMVQDVMPPARREAMLASAAALPAEPAMATLSEARIQPLVLEDASALEQQILQGKTIPAVLETAIHTDLPGSVRAMVDEDVYGEAGRMVVIPRMSRLVGEYRKDVKPGQTRVLVVWQRAILPDGRSLKLMSQGTDGLGRAGMAGEVDTHFLERFGAAFLVSMIGVAAENASRQSQSTGNGGLIIWGNESKSMAIEGLNSTVESMLKSQADIGPTIQIAQGSRVRVFVARDLDLSAASSASAPRQ